MFIWWNDIFKQIPEDELNIKDSEEWEKAIKEFEENIIEQEKPKDDDRINDESEEWKIELEKDLRKINEESKDDDRINDESEEWEIELENDLRKINEESKREENLKSQHFGNLDEDIKGLHEDSIKRKKREQLIKAYAEKKLKSELEEQGKTQENAGDSENSEGWKHALENKAKRLKVRTDEEERLSEEQLDEFLKNIRKMDDEAVLESKAKKIEEEKDKEELEKELAKQKKEYNNVETEVWKYKLGKDLREMDDDSVKEKENPFER